MSFKQIDTDLCIVVLVGFTFMSLLMTYDYSDKAEARQAQLECIEKTSDIEKCKDIFK